MTSFSHTATESVDVDLPLQEVYNTFTQFENFPHFMSGVDDVKQTSDTTTHWQVTVLGKSEEYDADIVEQHPDERIAWKSTSEPAHAGVATFHRLTDTETRVTLQMDWDPASFIERIGSSVGLVDRQIRNDLARFKEWIEEHGATDGWRGDVPNASETAAASPTAAENQPPSGPTTESPTRSTDPVPDTGRPIPHPAPPTF